MQRYELVSLLSYEKDTASTSWEAQNKLSVEYALSVLCCNIFNSNWCPVFVTLSPSIQDDHFSETAITLQTSQRREGNKIYGCMYAHDMQ
jgi:hypothetical protein